LDKQQAQNIVRETFEKPFDMGRFIGFVKNFLNSIDESKAFHARGYVPEIFKDHIKTYERIGTYTDPEDKKTDILIVYLQKSRAVERARTTQRNFIARYLKDRGEKDAGLIAFVSPDGEDWRFSFVKMEYKFVETPEGKVKVKEDFTPARRYSFLVGANENSHTAQSRLAPLLLDDESKFALGQIEDAFNIEKVTREFFEKYRDLYVWTKEALDKVVDNNTRIQSDFSEKSVNTVDFAKKLLGQIVFLYFLQKKGWFGVARDAKWGTGPKNFLRILFEKKLSDYGNFFNDILEPLFYEALAIERQSDFYSRFNCKIPFLNGGLFDPLNGYDWVHTDMLLPNELFSNAIKTKEGDTGTGILDVLDRYNFTVKEDEPLEKEVAVDPEMLGKVFENLLEVKDRKSKGTYYTPREIVHYMCQESLINYLDNVINTSKDVITRHNAFQRMLIGEDGPEQLGITEQKVKTIIPKADIESFIRHGVSSIEHDRRVEAEGRETKTYSYRMPESIRLYAELFDDALKTVKICDPAIGSGAFPVGMMHEIVRARETLTTYIDKDKGRTPYDFKRHAIQESIYGVDIDTGAVEIAKLRLWLSLIVEEDDYKTIKPLPNLDYKIVRGNSLSGVTTLFHYEALKKLEELKGKFFEETNPKNKIGLKEQIDGLISEITHSDKHFDFKVYFSEVLNRQGGFDIVIANPPYVRHEAIKELKPELKKQFGDFFCGTADIYTYFYHRGLEILKADGHLCFIAPNKFMRAGYGKNTRSLLAGKATPKIVIDFADLPIFDATTYPSIILIEKRLPENDDMTATATFSIASQLDRLEETLEEISFTMPVKALKSEGWNLERPDVLALMEKLRQVGTPLGEYVQGHFYRGVLTGLNEAFVVDATTRERLIAEDSKSEELIKPWLRGRDIRKWKAEWAGLYILNIPSSANKQWPWSEEKTEAKAKKIFEQTYPALYKHLSQWEDKLIKRDDQGKFWWELRSCAYYQEFEGPKIMYAEISTDGKFLIEPKGYYSDTTTYIMVSSSEYLLAILNSRLFAYAFSKVSSEISGGFFRWKRQYMEQLPIPTANDKQIAPIIERVLKILANPDSPDVPRLEREIDQLVYALYNLTPEEIAIVEGKG